MKKWSEVYLDGSQIVDFKEFNRGFNALKESLNGSIDRTMQSVGAYSYNRVKDNAFLKAVAIMRGDMSALRDGATGSLGFWRGLSYNTYYGGWVTIDQFKEIGMKAGFIHWEWGFHYFIDQWHTEDNPKKLQLQLICNGVVVASITPIGGQIGTFRAIADFPSVGGNLDFVVRGRTVAYGGVEGNETAWHITSQNHFIKGLWR